MLTIHVGLPKTGSSAIQRALQGMTATELRGIKYRGRESHADNDGFYGPAYHFQVPSGGRVTPTVRLLCKGRHVVLSEEGFFGHPYVPKVAAICSHASIAALAMREFFSDKTPFQVVVNLRAQHEWIESLYNQYLKSSRGANGIDSTEFAERAIDSPFFYWTRLVNELKEILGPQHLVVRTFRPGLNAVEDFLTILGLPTPERFTSPKLENASLTPARLALRKRLNEMCIETDQSHLAYWAARLDYVSSSPAAAPRVSLFTEDVQARLIEVAAIDWTNLSEAVADTHRAETHRFYQVAQDVQRSKVKPHLDLESLADGLIVDEAICQLIEALPYVATHPKMLPVRLRSLIMRAISKAQVGPRSTAIMDLWR